MCGERGGKGSVIGPFWWAKIIKRTDHFHHFYITSAHLTFEWLHTHGGGGGGGRSLGPFGGQRL